MLGEQQVYKSKYTFWMLLNEYRINIPIMQRDYAQGRKSENVTAIRSELIDAIYTALLSEKNIDFDFVYGTLKNGILYPLDGQQRLTTLYLLHWYIACKERMTDITKDVLCNFSYATRISSRDFCEKLVNLDYIPTPIEKPSEYIRNQNMYFDVWDNDPTISSMLVMLDVIHEKFFPVDKKLFKLLLRDVDENPIITFSYLPMENYALTDDLYIKMNARGKNLSDFENFKAKFILHMKKNGFPYEHFEKSIDTSWTDLLWDYRSKADNTIDEQFMYLFLYFTEMLYLEHSVQRDGNSPFKVTDIRGLISFYDSTEKIEELYGLLDLWKSKDEVDACFKRTFSDKYEQGKVRVFDDGFNLLNNTINKNGLKVFNKVLLFLFMKRVIHFNKKGILDTGLNDYVRVIRNFVLKVRQRKYENYSSDFRFCRHGIPYISFGLSELIDAEDVYEYLIKLKEDQRINSLSLKSEQDKAAYIIENPEMKETIQHLEDLDVFKSSIHNIMPFIRKQCIPELPDTICKLFNNNFFETLVRALLSVGDYGISIGGSYYGDRFYYGNREKDWYNILSTTDRTDYPQLISAFLGQYYDSEGSGIREKLTSIININLQSISMNDWRYYFVKYPSAVKNYENFIFSDNLIVLLEYSAANKFKVPHRLNGKKMNCFHACALYLEVSRRLCGTTRYVNRGKGTEDLSCLLLDSKIGIKLTSDHDIVLIKTEDNAMVEEICNCVKYDYNQHNLDGLDYVEKLEVMCRYIIEAEKIVV